MGMNLKWGRALGVLAWWLVGASALAQTTSTDDNTKGNWVGTYGSCAYALAGANSEVRCEVPIKPPGANPSCNGETCPGGAGTPLTCPQVNPNFPAGPNNPNGFVSYVGGATNALLDCAKTQVGTSGKQLKYSVRRCTALPDSAGASAQAYVWNSRTQNTWDPTGCLTNDASAMKLPAACRPPNKPLGASCTVTAGADRIASVWDDAMELATNGPGNGGAELCVDIDFTDITNRATTAYKLSTYLLDYDRANRSQSMTLHQCAPGNTAGNCEDDANSQIATQFVSGFSEGKYLSWTFNPQTGALPNRLTIRASRVNSLNAVISGLFLDAPGTAACGAPPPPEVTIKKYTNGWDGDIANGLPQNGNGPGNLTSVGQVAQVGQGGALTWTYIVKNTGSEILNNVAVSDDRGVAVSCPLNTLAVGESMTCSATGVAIDLTNTNEILGCGAGTTATRKTYVNKGTVVAIGSVTGQNTTASDLSAYCNPPKIKIVKFTNGHDGDNANGSPDGNPGNFSIGGGTVAQVAAGAAVNWTYNVTNTGPEPLVNVVVTDDRAGTAICPKTTLAPGETMVCTKSGVAASLTSGAPNVAGCGANGMGTSRPTYKNVGSVTGKGQISNVVVSDANPSHYCNPPVVAPQCKLSLTKSCDVQQAPTGDWASCRGKLAQFSMIWPAGAGTINISGVANNAPGGVVVPGQRVTFTGPFAVNDQIVNITGAVQGQSIFHVSCSDGDMDGVTTTNVAQQQLPGKAQDCGKFQGNSKTQTAGLINSWLLDGLIDAEGKVLNCTQAPAPTTNACSIEAQDPPSCGTGGSFKPSTLTFQYTGGGCGTQSNSQAAGKTTCTGKIDPTKPVNITFSGGQSFTNVMPGAQFTVPRVGTNATFTLSNAGGTEVDGVHLSCSQPLVVGDVYFSLTLVAEDGIGQGRAVQYSYAVKNTGTTPVSNITVEDDKLGNIPGSPIAILAPGATKILTATGFISKTTTNTAEAYDDASCAKGDVTSTATVTVVAPPPCAVSKTLYKVEENKITWEVPNDGNKTATLDTLTLNYPASLGTIKKVSFNGTVYEASKSNKVFSTGMTINAGDWTEPSVSKREVKAGDKEKLVIEFTNKVKKLTDADFSGTATFAEGCTLDLSK